MSPVHATTPVTISIRRSTDTPAVYVAGSFSDPKWEPFELTPKLLESEDVDGKSRPAEYLFSRNFDLPEGQYQYKFREGLDGQWFCDNAAKIGRHLASDSYLPLAFGN